MSYDIQLFRIETKEREQKSNHEYFFDYENNLVPFTGGQSEYLQKRLLIYDYIRQHESKEGLHFRNAEHGIDALLTERGLYLLPARPRKVFFEAELTASEFTDTGEFAKYDPQNGGWEEI